MLPQLRTRTINDTLQTLPKPDMQPLPAPSFSHNNEYCSSLVLGVSSMKDHMTDEGWQITHGLSQSGYLHVGHGLPHNFTNVMHILRNYRPATVVLQDKREWEYTPRSFRDPMAQFINVSLLSRQPHTFRLTILKDAQQRPQWHAEAAMEMGCHAWIIYYHPRIVSHLAPYTRPEHLIRTYHTLDPAVVPRYSPENRNGCLFSGAISGAYPLRQRISRTRNLPIAAMPHPGYHRKGCHTPSFLQTLRQYKVAICTSSMYGYALRKIIEATACGCRVITDLPIDEVLPAIDSNLLRIHPDIDMNDLTELIRWAEATYDPEVQTIHARQATLFYDYRYITRLLACDIAILRNTWKETL